MFKQACKKRTLGTIFLTGLLSVGFFIQGCGGGGSNSDPDPIAALSGLSGTAATGKPVADATITVKDKGGISKNATTDANGKYTIDQSGLAAPPYLVKVDLPSGDALYSVGGDAGVVNIHPYTDLIVETWYKVQGKTADDAFNDPTVLPPPTTLEVEVVASMVEEIIQKWMVDNGLDAENFDLIETSFNADHTGFDKVLDLTQVDVTTGTITIKNDLTAPTVTQSTKVEIDPITGSVKISTTTDANGVISTSTSQSVIPAGAEIKNAFTGVSATLAEIGATLASKGSNLSDADMTGFFDPNYQQNGFDESVGSAEFAADLKGFVADSFTVDRIRSYDPANQVVCVEALLSGTRDGAAVKEQIDGEGGEGICFKQQADGGWRMHGNQQIAEASIRGGTIHRMTGDPATEKIVKVLRLEVEGPQSVASVSAQDSTGASYAFSAPQTGSESFPTSGGGTLSVSRHAFELLIELPEFPRLGSEYSFILKDSAGAELGRVTDTLDASVSESISITVPSSHDLADTLLGQPITIGWSRPASFPVEKIELRGTATDGTSFCEVHSDMALDPTASSGTITFPSTCGGSTTSAVAKAVFKGVNGEEVSVEYALKVVTSTTSTSDSSTTPSTTTP